MAETERERKDAFVEAVNRICLEAGGVRLEGPVITWELNTQAGLLHVCPIDRANAPWIACRFLHPERVVAAADEINCYTGEWDFRLWAAWKRSTSPGWEPAYSNGLKYFEVRLKAVL
jgi:hypothetical protein